MTRKVPLVQREAKSSLLGGSGIAICTKKGPSARLVLGLGYNFEKHTAPDSAQKVTTIIKDDIWSKPDFLTSSGIRATQRLPKTIPFGREVFDV